MAISSKPPRALLAWCAATLVACGGPARHGAAPVVLTPDQANPIAYWHDVGAATVNARTTQRATEAETYAAFPADMATLHLAMYDAVMAITPRYRPFLFEPADGADGASVEAAAGTAAFRVLQALFPSRAQHYQQPYERFMAAIPDGAPKTRGMAVGAGAAAAHLARRAGDGRAAPLAPYVATDTPGRFRGVDPINRHWPAIRPYVLIAANQFRPGPPPDLGSARYAADFNEVKQLGGAASTRRTAEQTETARFHSEPPGSYFTRNFGRFARTSGEPADSARLMAALYAGYADAIGACLEAKYHYDTWRPASAIALAGTDNNPATEAQPDWVPLLPTPNHPEYPAAHSCSAGFVGTVLRHHFGTDRVTYQWDSQVTNTTRTYTHTGALADESRMARIYGGMHFRFSTEAGAQLGRQVGEWTMRQAFAAAPHAPPPTRPSQGAPGDM